MTDHDTTAGVAAAARAGEAVGLRVVAGCEFSVKAPWGELHVLGYFLPPGDPALETFLHGSRAARRRRGEEIVSRLQRLGVRIDLAAVRSQAGDGSLGRPHVARALVDAGVTADIGEAFNRFLGRGRPAFVEKPLPTLRAVTDLVHAVSGLAVAAHLGEHGTEDYVRRFRADGLDGLEVRHPSHNPAVEARLRRIAERLDLAVTGGSDWHGDTDFGDSHADLGGMRVPLEWLDQLEQRRTKTSDTGVSRGS